MDESLTEELNDIALYLCDDNYAEANYLLQRTISLARRNVPVGDYREWVISIMKHLYKRDEDCKRARSNVISIHNSNKLKHGRYRING